MNDNKKLNCWEFKKCGREPGGSKAAELGVCPSSIDDSYHGVHGGFNAGRGCWAVAGTFCHGERQGTFAQKIANCVECDFLRKVLAEEFGSRKNHPAY